MAVHLCIVFVKTELVSWCLKPSKPQGTMSGLRETFIKRYVVKRTDKAELRPEEQSEKTDNIVGRIYGIKYR